MFCFQPLIKEQLEELRKLIEKDFIPDFKSNSNIFSNFIEENEINLESEIPNRMPINYEYEWERAMNNDEKCDMFQPLAISQKMSEDPIEKLMTLNSSMNESFSYE